MTTAQRDTDRRNARFWDELCGTSLARSIGVTDASPESLARFDAAYFEMYPYLAGYMPKELEGRRVLEIGLGYGTLGQHLAERGADYSGLDIADGPVEMMRHRLGLVGVERAENRVVVGSALEIPHEDETFDDVISIGCLHHTGDIPRAVAEIHRVLKPGGRAVVMLYNARSLRQFTLRGKGLLKREADGEKVRAAYDANAGGAAAPVTEFTSRKGARGLFEAFGSVAIRSENFDQISLLRARLRIPRRPLLGSPARIAGLDLYVSAVKGTAPSQT